jgi:hypothetical protein
VARPDAVPDTPAAPVWTKFGDGELTATWTPPNSNGSPVTSYTLMLSPGGSPVTTSGTSYTFRGLTNGTAYTVQVRAHNRAPEPSAWSAPSVTEVPAAVPSAPSVRAWRESNILTGGQINVQWSPNATNGAAISAYELQYREVGGGWQLAPIQSGATSWSLTSARNGVRYEFAVRAQNKAGWSEPGPAEATSFGIPDTPTLDDPSPSQRADANDGWVALRWNAVSGNGAPISEYRVRLNGGEVRGVGQSTSYTWGRLPGGTQVTFDVQACNEAGCGAWSGARSATPVTAPAPVQGINGWATEYSERRPSRMSVSWSPPGSLGGGGAVSYQVTVTTSWGQRLHDSVVVTGESADVTLRSGIPENGAVIVSVVATTSGGSSSQSQQVTLAWQPEAPPTPPEQPEPPGAGTSP